MAEAPAVELRSVSFAYDGAAALEEVSFAVRPREAVCVVGPNGGGKTTLLRVLLGLLRPQAGQVRVLGDAPGRARRRVGYMPQHARHDPLFPVTALEVVLMGRLGRRRLGRYARADRRAALAALEEVGLAPLAGRPFADLSGGERQRVLLARALACEPELLLLDEPTASMDPAVEARLFELLRRLNERATLVMVSHDVGFVSQIVGKVVCLNRRAVVHPTSDVPGEIAEFIYRSGVRMVRHDRHCPPGEAARG